jgi:hypothetical protein
MNPENFPDKKLTELVEDESNAEWTEEDVADLEAEFKEYRDTMELMAAATILGRMMMDNKLTFREYIRLTNHVEDYQDEWGVTL